MDYSADIESKSSEPGDPIFKNETANRKSKIVIADQIKTLKAVLKTTHRSIVL
jgi:hypothetical protein